MFDPTLTTWILLYAGAVGWSLWLPVLLIVMTRRARDRAGSLLLQLELSKAPRKQVLKDAGLWGTIGILLLISFWWGFNLAPETVVERVLWFGLMIVLFSGRALSPLLLPTLDKIEFREQGILVTSGFLHWDQIDSYRWRPGKQGFKLVFRCHRKRWKYVGAIDVPTELQERLDEVLMQYIEPTNNQSAKAVAPA